MSEEKREKIIKVRVTAAEHEQLQHLKTRHQLAEWMREHCLNPTGDLVRESQGAPIKADPELVRHLAAVGNNINQIARRLNQLERASAVDLLDVRRALDGIRQSLEAYRPR